MKTINQIADLVHNLAWEKGWHSHEENEDAFIERACNNLHDEISELHEAWRNNQLHQRCDKANQMEAMKSVDNIKVGDRVYVPRVPGTISRLCRTGVVTTIADRYCSVAIGYGNRRGVWHGLVGEIRAIRAGKESV